MRKTISAVILTATVAVSAVALAKLPALRADESKVYVENSYAVPSGDVAINSTNFPDANFRTYVSQFDKDNSGGLSTSEISAVTEIDCSSKSISDLTGISYFTSLKTLNCKDNQISILNLRSNTALQTVFCSNNRLTSLNVNGLTRLGILECRNNQLSSINVEKNTALYNFDCTSNKLTSLNVKKNTELKYLYCSFNEITELDVSKNPSLRYLYCYKTGISQLDVENCQYLHNVIRNIPFSVRNSYKSVKGTLNDLPIELYVNPDCNVYPVPINETNFPDKTFRELVDKYDNIIKNSELSLNEMQAVKEMQCWFELEGEVYSFQGIEYFTELTYLECSGYKLTSLDVSKNTKLTHLFCSDDQLTALDVSKNTELKILSCYDNQLTSLDVSKNTALTELWCNGNQLTSLDVSKNTALTELWCDGNQLASLDVSKNTALIELWCHYNQLTTLDLSKNTALKHLWCSHNQLTTLDVSKNTALKYLWCEHNQLTSLDIHLCQELDSLVKTSKREEAADYSFIYSSTALLYFDKNVTLITSDGALVGTIIKLKAVSAGRNKVKLTWDPISEADGYLVYGKKNGKYAYVGMTTQGTTFTDTKALDNDWNYYWVFAYAKDSHAKMIPGGCLKYVYAKGVCLAVTDLKASSGAGYVKLSWTASAGADGYLIYGIRPGAAYGYIGMTTQGTTFTDTKASKADYTFYWVFPYHKDANGNMIVGGTAKYTYGKAR